MVVAEREQIPVATHQPLIELAGVPAGVTVDAPLVLPAAVVACGPALVPVKEGACRRSAATSAGNHAFAVC
jgi:hypothetical protein